MADDIVRIANCSGFYGDRLSAAREMVEGGPIDFLTGDYLAELTMAILFNQRMARGEDKGYVGTFLKQVKEVIGPCLDKGIKIVSNAGGLNPKSMANEVEKIVSELGLKAKIAYIDGDDLMPRIADLQAQGVTLPNMDTGQTLADSGLPPVSANVYFGGWGIKEALDQGADIVIAPRVTDAAVVIGPAAHKFNWKRTDYDALAGSLAAGHIIECGCQATGGNYSFIDEVPSYRNVGFPIAEIEANGNFTITKHPGTGGLVSVGTVTAQLLYEISTPGYLNPDVIGHFDTMKIEQSGPDRVYVSGTKGSSPPETMKVCVNLAGGYRNGMQLLLTGLDVEKKAEVYTDAFFDSVGGKDQFDSVTVQLIRSDKEDPVTNEEAAAELRILVTSQDPNKVGRLFNAKATELGLASYAGLNGRGGVPSGPFITYWPTLISSQYIVENLYIDGQKTEILPHAQAGLGELRYKVEPATVPDPPGGETVRMPLGRLFGTRSGDKGGNANLGIWARTDEAFAFLYDYLTVDELKKLLPDAAQFDIDRYEMPNMKALNFYVHGILGRGVSSSTRIDGQAKSLGEYLRAKYIDVPKVLADQL